VSHFLTNAGLIKDRLDAHFAALGEGWENVGTVVYRQKDIEAECDTLLARAGGAAVTILWDGFSIPNPESRTADTLVRYSVAVWCQPTTGVHMPPSSLADEVVEQVVRALHGWAASGRHAHLEFRIGGCALASHPTYLIYDLACTVRAQIV
jgi:hypothetical protein